MPRADRSRRAESAIAKALRTAALGHPDVQEGIACKGTPLECSTFKARGKAFLFLGAAEARVKLRESQDEATRLAKKEPDRYRVGAHGWATVKIGDGESAPLKLLLKWIDESHRIFASERPGRRATTGA